MLKLQTNKFTLLYVMYVVCVCDNDKYNSKAQLHVFKS